MSRNSTYATADEMALEAIRLGFIRVDPVQGVAFSVRFHGKQLGCKNGKGYIVFTLHLDGDRRQIKMHRLIWLSVHGIPPAGLDPDHINRRKDQNGIHNLRLASAKLNAENRRNYRGSNNPAAKLTKQIVQAIRSEYATRDRTKYHHGMSYRTLAQKFKVSPSLIRSILSYSIWKP